jgi:septal ring factor EnvC (AmiA/AmiB activator)
MKTAVIAIAAVCMTFATAAVADSQTPYAGLQTRSIKALSEKQIADLRAGKGMSLALAAELNGYPGPAHVLELSDRLRLTPVQRERVAAEFKKMQTEASALGEQIIAQEAELDRLFADRTVTPASLQAVTDRIAILNAQLRRAHLAYHLTTRDLLNPEQNARYAELRGYGGAPHHHDGMHHHHRKH